MKLINGAVAGTQPTTDKKVDEDRPAEQRLRRREPAGGRLREVVLILNQFRGGLRQIAGRGRLRRKLVRRRGTRRPRGYQLRAERPAPEYRRYTQVSRPRRAPAGRGRGRQRRVHRTHHALLLQDEVGVYRLLLASVHQTPPKQIRQN